MLIFTRLCTCVSIYDSSASLLIFGIDFCDRYQGCGNWGLRFRRACRIVGRFSVTLHAAASAGINTASSCSKRLISG